MSTLKDLYGKISGVKNKDFLRFIDGGIVHNDPSLIGLIEAKKLYGEHLPILLISVGTGALPPQRAQVPKSFIDLSTSLFGGLFDAKESSCRMIVRNLLKEGGNYFRFCPEIAVNDMADAQYLSYWVKRGYLYAKTPSVLKKLEALAKYCSQFSDKLNIVNNDKQVFNKDDVEEKDDQKKDN